MFATGVATIIALYLMSRSWDSPDHWLANASLDQFLRVRVMLSVALVLILLGALRLTVWKF